MAVYSQSAAFHDTLAAEGPDRNPEAAGSRTHPSAYYAARSGGCVACRRCRRLVCRSWQVDRCRHRADRCSWTVCPYSRLACHHSLLLRSYYCARSGHRQVEAIGGWGLVGVVYCNQAETLFVEEGARKIGLETSLLRPIIR